MRHVRFLLLLSLWPGLPLGAQSPAVRFTQLPAPLQLYPRTDRNAADVPVRGRVTQAGYRRVSLSVFRNNAPFAHQRQEVSFPANADFSFLTTIRAELAEYRFDVYLHGTGGDSVRVARRDSVVCGDVFLINGQSNATTETGMAGYTYRNEFHRTFGRAGVEVKRTDTLWTLANRPGALVGVWGQEVQRLITETYKIPVCILNGGLAGTDISFQFPNALAPDDLATSYGRLLFRARQAGVQHAVKAIFWRQGEAEAFFRYPGYEGYGPRFELLYRAWKRDYPSARRIYVFQNNLVGVPDSPTAGEVLEFQRRSQDLYPDVVALATVGLPGYDGTHYNTAGYVASGLHLFRLVARDFYGATDTAQIASPTVRKAFFTSEKRDAIQLQFDAGQRLRWPADTTLRATNGTPYTRRMRDFFYLEKTDSLVAEGRAEGNVVTLTLRRPAPDNLRRLSYLPAAFADQWSKFYDGPHLRNGRGMGAFAFQDVPIAAALPAPDLTAQAPTLDTIRLAWSPPAGGTTVVLERSADGGRTFAAVGAFPDSVRAFTDVQNLVRGFAYLYRVKAVSADSESPFDTARVVTGGFQVLNFSAKALSFDKIQLDWAATTGAAGFALSVLERATRPDSGFVEIARLPYPAAAFTDSLLRPNTAYFYRVRVLGSGTESAPVGTTARTMAVTGTEPAAPEVRVFPNPTRQAVVVEWPQAQSGTLTLADAQGGVRLRHPFQNLRRLDLPLPALPPGLYLLRTETAAGTVLKKLLVE